MSRISANVLESIGGTPLVQLRKILRRGGARIVVKGREHESQHDLLADAIRSVTDNPLFLESFFTNQIVPNVEPAMQRRLRNALCWFVFDC